MNECVNEVSTILSKCVLQEMRSSSPLPVGKVNQLHEAMAAYPDVKPRSMEWCLKLVDALFKSKRVKVYICRPPPPHAPSTPLVPSTHSIDKSFWSFFLEGLLCNQGD